MQMLEKQKNISAQVPMPVTDMESSSVLTTISPAETTTFVIASTNANSAGEAAGTVVYFRLAHNRIASSSGASVGHGNDSSFAFVTGTCLTTQKLFPSVNWEGLLNDWSNNRATKMAAIGALLANGEFVLDHRSGLCIGKKATTADSDTANYKYLSNSSTTSGSSGSADGSAFTAGSTLGQPISALVDETATTTVTEDKTGVIRMSARRAIKNDMDTTIAGENISANALQTRYNGSATRITTATTTTVKSGSGHILGILVGTTAAGAITIYDNTAGSGTVIGALKSSIAEGFYQINANFSVGCTVVTAAASDITVITS